MPIFFTNLILALTGNAETPNLEGTLLLLPSAKSRNLRLENVMSSVLFWSALLTHSKFLHNALVYFTFFVSVLLIVIALLQTLRLFLGHSKSINWTTNFYFLILILIDYDKITFKNFVVAPHF